MKKVSIATFCNHEWHTNYGQVLQCYAMQEICKKLGMKVQVIRYREKNSRDLIKERLPIRFLNSVYEDYCQKKFIKCDSVVKIKKFQNFMKKNVRLTHPCYTVKEVEKATNDSDILMCGSDQVWNPLGLKKVFMLDFGKKEQKRIAYAASGIIPESKFTIKKYKELSEVLKNFDYISIREESGVSILNKYANKNIVDVLDPTLLLSANEWNNVAKDYSVKSPYIFAYTLKGIRPYKMILTELMKKYNAEKIVYIDKGIALDGYESENFIKASDIGPEEFISLIKNSNAVCTDSFHGVAFSINYRKQFVTLSNKAEILYRYEDRQNNLLYKCHINNRKCDALYDIEELKNINYEEVEKYLDMEKEKSWLFLKKSVESKSVK